MLPSASGLSQSQSNNPTSATGSSGSSSSSANISLTIEAALQAASNNPLAALEAVVAERNTLASQNNQLWRLVEKQRAMYHAANRELEKLKKAAGAGTSAGRSGSPSNPTPNGSQTSKRADRPERPERADGRGKLSQSSTDDHRK